MAERSAVGRLGLRILFAVLVLIIFFVHLLPLTLQPAPIAGPDLLVALCFAWAMRRPDAVPALLIAAVMLTADLLFQRPPGLWAALVLMAAEWLKRQDRRLRDGTFLAEWSTVTIALLAITLVYRLVQGVLIVPPGTLLLSATQFGMTILAYPLVVFVSHVLFGVRRSAPGEYDPLGRTP